MPGEFVISPRHPISSQPIHPFRSPAPQPKPQDVEAARPSYESSDSLSKDKQQQQQQSEPKSGMRAALSRAAHRLASPSRSAQGRGDALAGSEEEFERLRKQEVEAQKRKEEYEKFKLGSKGLAPGSMQMHG